MGAGKGKKEENISTFPINSALFSLFLIHVERGLKREREGDSEVK